MENDAGGLRSSKAPGAAGEKVKLLTGAALPKRVVPCPAQALSAECASVRGGRTVWPLLGVGAQQ